MTTSLTNPGPQTSRGGIDRRKILAGTAALATSAVAATAAGAATVAPLGQTGAPTRQTDRLPLGPLSGGRYPDSHLEMAKKPSKPTFGGTSGFPAFAGTMAVERVATGFRWAEARFTSRPGSMSCSATSPTTASCASRRTTVISASTASRR